MTGQQMLDAPNCATQANRVRSLVRKMFNLAELRG